VRKARKRKEIVFAPFEIGIFLASDKSVRKEEAATQEKSEGRILFQLPQKNYWLPFGVGGKSRKE
jgi:hypothetical protein